MTSLTSAPSTVAVACVFCKILKKEIPANFVYENADFVAFLSIDPRSPGHTLVIPRAHHRWVWDVPNLAEYFAVAQKIAFAQRKAFGQEAILGHIEGHDVPHAHIWVYPDVQRTTGDKKDFKENARKIVEALKGLQ